MVANYHHNAVKNNCVQTPIDSKNPHNKHS